MGKGGRRERRREVERQVGRIREEEGGTNTEDHHCDFTNSEHPAPDIYILFSIKRT